jgi:hypothetical protein
VLTCLPCFIWCFGGTLKHSVCNVWCLKCSSRVLISVFNGNECALIKAGIAVFDNKNITYCLCVDMSMQYKFCCVV